MNQIYIEAGIRIREIRNHRGYTGKTLAKMAGISQKFLSEIENGKKGFSGEVLYNLSKALKVDADYILTGNNVKVLDEELAEATKLFGIKDKEQLIKILKEISGLL